MIIKNHYIIVTSILLLLTGCGSDSATPDKKKKKVIGFQTNQSTFMTKIDKVSSSKEDRNAFIDEFITKSNLQCQYYLISPQGKSSEKKSNSKLYISIFDAVSQAFGIKQITDVAKELYSSDDESSKNAKNAYESALTPEIIRGVKISRKNYAQKMILRKPRLIESYTIPMVKQDIRNYDKLCNYETGLIEINKALKKAQKQPKVKPFSPSLKIDPTLIKDKVEAMTKEAEAQEGIQSENQYINESQKPNETAF